MQSDLLAAHKFDIFVTYHLKPLGVGVGWGGVGHVNVRLHLRHEVDATSRMGLRGVVWQVNVRLHLRHDVDATSRMGLGLGGVGWGMLTFACTCVMMLMLRHAWGWVGWGGAC